MRILIEAPYTKAELAMIIEVLQVIDERHPHQVQSLLVDEPGFAPEEWVQFCRERGLPYTDIIDGTGGVVHRWFEGGGGVRMIPLQEGE